MMNTERKYWKKAGWIFLSMAVVSSALVAVALLSGNSHATGGAEPYGEISSGANLSQEEATPPAGEDAHKVDSAEAFRFAEELSQPLISGRSKSYLVERCIDDLVAHAMSNGDIDLAEELARRQRGSQKWLTLASLARGTMKSGDTATAQRLLDEILPARTPVAGVRREWIDMEIAALMAALGQTDEALELASSLTDDARRENALATVHVEMLISKQDVDLTINSDELGLPSNYAPEYIPVGMALLDIVDFMLKSENDELKVASADLVATISDFVDKTKGNATRYYLKLTEIYFNHGMIDEMETSLARAFPHFAHLSGGTLAYYEMVASLSKMAEAAGQKDVAMTLLDKGLQPVDLLQGVDRAEAVANIAKARADLGYTDEARSLFVRAIQEAAGIPNPVAARYGAVRTALLMAESGISPTPEIMQASNNLP